MIDLTKKYTMEELASLHAHMNCWEWPTEILGPKPWYWENARNINSSRALFGCKRFEKLFHRLEEVVPSELRSRAWWIEILGRTEEEWRVWWNITGKYIF